MRQSRIHELLALLDEAGINAFAAGHSPADAVIGVTRGCVQLLSRDELQGVVAHEFSHILNGDMRLTIRLIGVLFGILMINLMWSVVRIIRRPSVDAVVALTADPTTTAADSNAGRIRRAANDSGRIQRGNGSMALALSDSPSSQNSNSRYTEQAPESRHTSNAVICDKQPLLSQPWSRTSATPTSRPGAMASDATSGLPQNQEWDHPRRRTVKISVPPTTSRSPAMT